MKRPALYIGIPCVLGLTLASAAARTCALWLLGGIVLAGAVLLVWRRDLWKYLLLSTLSCLTACCVYWHADKALLRQEAYAGRETTFTGKVTQAVTYESGCARYYLDGALDGETPARVEFFTCDPYYFYGDTLTLTGIPERMTSGYLFDAAGYARSQRIVLQFSPETRIEAYHTPDGFDLRRSIHRWRETMTQRIRSQTGEETGAMLTGMLFGDRSGMSRSSKTALYRMGIGHVLAVSGLHLDFLALLAAAVLRRLRAGRGVTFAAVAVLCLLFVICTGETVSAQRACIMILIRQLGDVLIRKPDNLTSLSIAVLFLGIRNPFVVHSGAFWLTVSFTLGIAVIGPYMTRDMPWETVPRMFVRDFCACCWAFLTAMPVCVLYFREVSLLNPVSNTLLVPVCLGAMLFGVLALLLGCRGWLAALFLGGADVMNGWILEISRAVTAVSWTHASTSSRVLLFGIAAGAVLAVLIHLAGRNRRLTTWTVVGALLVTGISVYAEHGYRRDAVKIAFLGEGKSRLIAVTDGNDAVLLDLSGGTQAGAYAEAYLTEEGIRNVRALYLCDPDAKNLRNYAGYLTYYEPGELWLMQNVSREFPAAFTCETHRADTAECTLGGARITVDAVSVRTELPDGTVCIAALDAAHAEAADILCVYGKRIGVLPESGILLLPDAQAPYVPDDHTYIGESGLELTAARDGTCRIRRLYGEN